MKEEKENLKKIRSVMEEMVGFEITKDTLLEDILSYHPYAFEILSAYGLACAGCPISVGETLEEAALVHNINLECLIEDLNTDFSEEDFNNLESSGEYIQDIPSFEIPED